MGPYVLKTPLLLLLFQIVHARSCLKLSFRQQYSNCFLFSSFFDIQKSLFYLLSNSLILIFLFLITYREEDEESGGLRCVGAVVAAASDWNE